MSKELIDNAKDLREIGEGIREPICFAAADELESLRAQLKEAQAEIERLYSERGIISGHLIKKLHGQLAASQANEVQLREALEYIRHIPISEHYRINALVYSALSLPSDTTALESMIQKAGEVMRERCLSEIDPGYYSPNLARHVAEVCCNDIRALPGVTLQDLQNKSDDLKK